MGSQNLDRTIKEVREGTGLQTAMDDVDDATKKLSENRKNKLSLF